MKQLERIRQITLEGLQLFENTFGFRSRTFVACNYIWPAELESTLHEQGVELIQCQRGRVEVKPDKQGKTRVRRQYTGMKLRKGLRCSVRNVSFEPFEDPGRNWVDFAIRDVDRAFYWHKPAIVSTHRINYVGTIDLAHRDRNLKMLREFLERTLKKWPDVEFMSSDQLANLICEGN